MVRVWLCPPPGPHDEHPGVAQVVMVLVCPSVGGGTRSAWSAPRVFSCLNQYQGGMRIVKMGIWVNCMIC